MLALRRKLTDALGGGAPSSASPSSSSLSSSSARELPAPLVITSAGVASPPPPSLAVRIPESKKSPSLSMATIGSPRAASPAPQSSPLHEHQPQAPRRASIAWVPDNLADKCYACSSSFSLLVRRHHCRRCGNVFCDACSQARMPLVAAGFLTPVRVCDKCCVAAKKAHARLVTDRQQQWLQEQNTAKEKRHRLRSLHSDDTVTYDVDHAAHVATAALPCRHVKPSAKPSSQFLRSQTVKQLYAPPIAAVLRKNNYGVVSTPPKAFFGADPYGHEADDEDERRSFERRTGLESAGDASNEVSVQTLPGEVLLVRCENVLCRLMNQHGETEGTLYITSYRLVFSPMIDVVPEYDESDEGTKPPPVHQAIPLGTIERLKRKESAETDTGLLDIVTKDFRHVQFFFHGLVAKQTFNQFDRSVYTIRQYAFGEPAPVAETFLRATATATASTITFTEPFDGWNVYDAATEFRRLGVGADAAIATPRWRLTSVNEDYGLCPTYPSLLAVPSSVGDQVLAVAAKYRSKARIPVLSWRNIHTGAVICRSSQPLVGLGQRQCDKDVFLIQAISVANPSSSKFVIIDARPWKNAVAQKTVGRAGYELTEQYETRHSSATSKFADLAASSTDFGGLGTSTMLPSPPSSGHQADLSYDDDDDSASTVSDRVFRQMDASLDPSLILTECKLIFMGIENIHTMRKSYNKLLDLCIHKPTDKWVEHLGATRWIEHISKILDSAVEIVRIVHDEKSSVLVHCSDGWDRTPQLTSLAQLMMDPYYRTIEGFQVLIEKEWCSFGHKFRDRTAHYMNPTSSSDISPVFLQFVDCVWQICRQFPCAFEFNEQFLMLILDHLYSCRFGTFMFDSERDRRDRDAKHSTVSLWTYIASLARTEITNVFYIAPRTVNAATISEELLSPDQNQTTPADIDDVLTASLQQPIANAVDERDEDDSAMDLFPSASAPIKIPASDDSTTSSSPNGLPASRPASPQSPPRVLPRTSSNASRSSTGSSRDPNAPIPGLVEEPEQDDVLRPCAWSRALQFWTRYYLRWDPSTLMDRVANVWIESAHRELKDRLEDAERQLQALSEASQEASDRDSSVHLPELVQIAVTAMGEEGPVTATVPYDVIEKLEALEQRKRDELARIEKEFEEAAAKLLQPTLERPATVAC